MKKQVSKAMEICAANVREISCVRCRHYEKCVRNNCVPISMLGRYLAWLKLEALPPLENELLPICSHGLRLEAHTPNISELEKGAFAVVRIYRLKPMKRIIARVLLLDLDYDAKHLRTSVFNAYIRGNLKGE